ncbi:MAG: tRNA preQ1(34) S-adenosylmethionine ribosyltransferase-isomerase QueA, partial [Cyanobacteria bacterium]|nr:tRNA preQ1(34) S-adenosylmethionine ribosyltransferase-isomerase QueA [Cyanobacteriota bacterium]
MEKILESTLLEKELSPDCRLSNYDYQLPEELIAKFPLAQRDASRMMVLDRKNQTLNHHHFYDLPSFLSSGDLIIVNNTKVLPARLRGNRVGLKGKVEILMLYPSGDNPLEWVALMKPTKKLKPGTRVEFPGTASTIEIINVDERVRGRIRLHLDEFETVTDFLEAIGEIPIPPYLNRPVEAEDKETYQTVYSKSHDTLPDSQAAPTAGLHFTPAVLNQLKEKGVQVKEITLSVSSGTFRSVGDEDITLHTMDPEIYNIPEEVAQAIAHTKASGGKVFAIGTTVTKTLETAASKNQGLVKAGSDWSQLFIYPGFKFQVIDGLLTNFH